MWRTLCAKRGKEFGFSMENLTLDYSVAVKRSRQVSDRLVKGVGFLMKKNNIDVHMGAARVTARDTVVVTDQDGKTSELKAKNIVVATGASVAVPPGWTIDGQKIVTYLEAILQEKLPKSVVVIGAGAIGVEFATIWRSYGVEVTIVEMLPRIVPLEDEEVSEELAKALKRRKINLLPGHRVLGIQATESGVQVKVASEQGEKTLEAEQALVAIGFKPNGRGLGLEEAGCKAQRARSGRDRRADGHQCAGHLGDRRCDCQADAGARRLGPGHYLRREYRRRRDHHPEL